MRKFLLLVLIVSFIGGGYAQGQDNSKIGFVTKVSSQVAPANVVEYLEGKLSEILTSEGIALSSGDFIMEATINELSKNLVPTAPARIQLQLEITFKAIDKREGVVLNATSVTCSGMNTTEEATYMSAIRSANLQTRNFLNFIAVSKERIYEFYNNECECEATSAERCTGEQQHH